eukprot:1092347-Prorocentrum_minimum.AAC.2
MARTFRELALLPDSDSDCAGVAGRAAGRLLAGGQRREVLPLPARGRALDVAGVGVAGNVNPPRGKGEGLSTYQATLTQSRINPPAQYRPPPSRNPPHPDNKLDPPSQNGPALTKSTPP